MKFLLFSTLICLFIQNSKASSILGGGSTVGNGGGGSEQAVMFVADQYTRLGKICQQYPSCQSQQLEKLLLCPRPNSTQIKFAVPQDNSQLRNGNEDLAYAYEPLEQSLILNRTFLIDEKNQNLRTPTAFSFLSRIYSDLCGLKKFADTASDFKNLEDFFNQEFEQLTIGKDQITLPIEEWIYVRTVFSTLLIETPGQLYTLACPNINLSQCHISSQQETAALSFYYLSLSEEKLEKNKLSVKIEGVLSTRQNFQLSLVFEDQKLVQATLNGYNLKINGPL